MKKLFNVLAVITCTMFFAACEYYDHAITGHEDRLSQLENSYIKSVEEQIEGINNSLYHLEAIDTALYALRDSLAQEIENDTPLLPDDNIPEGDENEGEGNEDENENQGGEGNDEGNENENPEDEGQEAIRRNAEKRDSTLSVLMTAIDAEIADFDNKIAELRNYVDSCMPSVVSSPQDWIEITLATMERSLKVQTEVAELKSLIEIHKADITASYMAALDEAIANCETSMKGWVNEGLAQKYNEIAALDGELNVLATKADSTNIALTEQIATQQAALEQAKTDLTAAYKQAIETAVQDGGVINAAIAEAVQEAQDALQVQIDAINVVLKYIKDEILTIKGDIGDIQGDIEIIQDSIATIGEQIDGINSSLKDLTKVDSTLQILIAALEAEAESLQNQLDANSAADAATKQALEDEIAEINAAIAALQARDKELDQKINNLKNYVDSISSSTQDWVETTFSTLEQYGKMQTEIADIRATIEYYKSEFTTKFEEALVAIEEAFAESKASMMTWVNDTLQAVYYDIATIDGKLAALESKTDSVDKSLTEQIEAQQAALEQAKTDLTTAYEKAIKEAIEENNGKISEEIAKAVKDAQEALQSQIDAINSEIEAIKTEIALIKESIATINTQIENINVSLQQLEEVDAALLELIESLEAEAEELQNQLDANSAADAATKQALEEEIANINALIAALQAKDEELDQKIDDLRAYVEGEISATENWAEATFATLEEYTAMQTEIATLAALIDTYKQELTNAYTAAIEAAVTDMQTAIANLETSMKGWVNETLTEGYYDIAAIDALLAALEAKLANADAGLAEQIAAQQAALERAKAELTEAYEKAIKEAIEENNGKISEEIAKAVKDAQDALQGQIDAINGEIEAIKAEIALIKESIATINTQIENINASLQQLEEVDAALLELIESLEAEAEELQNQLDANSAADAATKQALEEEIANINALIAALQAKDEELDQKIAELQAYVDQELANTKDWANATFATLEQYAAMQTEIATLAALIDTYKQELTDDYTAAIEAAVTDMQTAIANLETSMKGWVNETLTEGYYDIAAIDALLAALEAKLANADNALAEQIAAQQAALEQAKTDLTAAYEAAIKKAIEENNGKISKEINAAVEAATNELNTKIAIINAEINDIKDEITLIKESIADINTSLGQLKEKNEALQELIDALEAKAEELQKQFEDADAATKQELERQNATIQNLIEILQEEDENLQKQIDDLQKQIDDLKKGSVSKDDIAAIERAIDDLEAQMDNLEKTLGDIDAINRRLDELEQKADNYATDKELSDAIDAIYDKLDELYDAINNGGNTGEDWSDDIADIYETLNDIMDRLDALENLGGGNASGNIQSIRFIPEYNDGKVDLSFGQATLTFILTPYEAASAVAQEYKNSKGVITAYISRTKTRTRAIDTPQTLTITSVTGNANGILEIGINTNSLPSNYWDDMTSANIYIRINDGNNDIVSEMIPAFESLPTTTTVEMVDLGLSVKWASCNVGASSPESYGNYYAWAETKDIEWSGDLRMPTAEEMKELREQCVWKWTKSNGVYGYRVSRNGNSIFLPASGFHLNNRAYDSGEYGYYWATGSSNQANVLEFNVDNYYSNGNEPTYSCTVRPVSK